MSSSSSSKVKYPCHIMQDNGRISILEKLRKEDNPFWVKQALNVSRPDAEGRGRCDPVCWWLACRASPTRILITQWQVLLAWIDLWMVSDSTTKWKWRQKCVCDPGHGLSVLPLPTPQPLPTTMKFIHHSKVQNASNQSQNCPVKVFPTSSCKYFV